MGIRERVTQGLANLLLADEIGAMQEREQLLLNAYAKGRAAVSPQMLERQLSEVDSRLVDLTLRQYGWQRLGGQAGDTLRLSETDRQGMIAEARHMTFYDSQSANAIHMWTRFGLGQTINVRVEVPEDAELEDVSPESVGDLSEVAQGIWREFWKARRNKNILRTTKISKLSDEAVITGELFLAFYTSTVAAPDELRRTSIRHIKSEQIVEILSDPLDATNHLWYIQRLRESVKVGERSYSRVAFPDWQASEEELAQVELPDNTVIASEIGNGTEVVMLYAALNEFDGRGWPEFRTAYQWFREYGRGLGAVLAKLHAVAQFIDKIKIKGGSRAVDQIQETLSSTLGSLGGLERNPAPVPGSTWLDNPEVERQRLPLTTGAGDDAMTTGLVLGQGYSATSIPVGLVRSDQFQNRSVAETVMLPWYEAMESYQAWWSEVFEDIVSIVLRQAGFEQWTEVVVTTHLDNPIRPDLAIVRDILHEVVTINSMGLGVLISRDAIEALLQLIFNRLGLKQIDVLVSADEQSETPDLGEQPEVTPGAAPDDETEEVAEGMAEALLKYALDAVMEGHLDADDAAALAMAEMQNRCDVLARVAAHEHEHHE